MIIEENYSLLRHNTFGIDVKTRWFIEYESEAELKKILTDEYFLSLPFLQIGEGSNLLFLSDFDGIIMHSRIMGIEVLQKNTSFVDIKAGAGVMWEDLVAHCVEQNWGGIENLSFIPGETGAAAVQNIGAYGAEIKDCLLEVHAYNIETGVKEIFSNADCKYAYRESIFKTTHSGKYILTHVVLRLSTQPVFNLEYGNLKEVLSSQPEINLWAIRNAIIRIRENKLPDPKKTGNAGSFFKNPYICKEHYEVLKLTYPEIPHYPVDEDVVKVPAAWLIDQCGWKGKQMGRAAVHNEQPLVLVNTGGATGADIATLAEAIRQDVKKVFLIDLEPEVLYI